MHLKAKEACDDEVGHQRERCIETSRARDPVPPSLLLRRQRPFACRRRPGGAAVTSVVWDLNQTRVLVHLDPTAKA